MRVLPTAEYIGPMKFGAPTPAARSMQALTYSMPVPPHRRVLVGEIAVRPERAADREAHAVALAGLAYDLGRHAIGVLDRELQHVEAEILDVADEADARRR